MRRLALCVALVVAGTLPAAAFAGGEGITTATFARTISSGALEGRWTMELTSEEARYTIRLGGALVARGRLSESGNRSTFRDTSGPGRCAGAGTYTTTPNEARRTVRFRLVRDSCSNRAAVLVGTWKPVATA